MKRILLAALLVAAATVPVSAATLWVGHGIDGRDLGLPKKDLPVDVCLVAGGTTTALFTGVTFGQFAQVPADLAAGRYDVEVRLADPTPCKGAVAIAASVFLGFGENATALAHLNEQGVPTLTRFTNDLRPLADGKARIYARHAAAFGPVNVYLRQEDHRSIVIRGLENPEQKGATVRAGEWFVGIYDAASWRRPAFSATLDLEAGKAYFAYAVGTPSDGTFTVLLQKFDAAH